MNLIGIFVLLAKFYEVICKIDDISCNYKYTEKGSYYCDLVINNPSGLNNFSDIKGQHQPNDNDDDVRGVWHYEESSSTSLNVPSVLCKKFRDLKYISLFKLGISRIDDFSFSGCKRLLDVQLHHNNLKVISNNSFANNPNLMLIQITMNSHLKTLPESLFKNQNRLVSLALDHNKLSSLPENIFKGLRAIKNLFLNNNDLHTLKPEWFSSLITLETLLIQVNPIQFLPRNVFRPLKNLVELKLYRTDIRVLDSNSFGRHPQLKFLNVHGNRIFAVDDLLFNNVFHDIELEFKDNSCADKVIKGAQLIKEALFTCITNFKQSLEVCRREIATLNLTSSNHDLLRSFDHARASDMIIRVGNEIEQLRIDNNKLKAIYKPDQSIGDSQNDEEQSVDKESEN
ncbi:hypothetical protein ACKWTF_001577 [Chironomus riparius]